MGETETFLAATMPRLTEDGEWRVAHRHGDSPKSVASHRLAKQLQAGDR
jgi:hypothetical protein